jgi:hypothetical protein
LRIGIGFLVDDLLFKVPFGIFYLIMKTPSPEQPMPSEVQRTIDILAPKGSSVEQKIAAIKVATVHHEAMQTGAKPRRKLDK